MLRFRTVQTCSYATFSYSTNLGVDRLTLYVSCVYEWHVRTAHMPSGLLDYLQQSSPKIQDLFVLWVGLLGSATGKRFHTYF